MPLPDGMPLIFGNVETRDKASLHVKRHLPRRQEPNSFNDAHRTTYYRLARIITAVKLVLRVFTPSIASLVYNVKKMKHILFLKNKN